MDIQLRNQNDCTLAVDPLVLILSCQSRAGLRRLSRVGARDVMVAKSAPSALSALGAGQVFLRLGGTRRRASFGCTKFTGLIWRASPDLHRGAGLRTLSDPALGASCQSARYISWPTALSPPAYKGS